MPWLLFILMASSALLIILANAIIKDQINERHTVLINNFHQKIENNLDSLQEQVQNIARNDLITNSLIDPEESQNYIPLFIRSFALSGVKNTYIQITDFSGETITENSFKKDKNTKEIQWKTPVLEEGKSFLQIDSTGLFIAAPIIFSQDPEGAVFSAIPIHEFTSLLLSTKNEIIAIIDKQGKILFSSNHSAIPPNKIYNDILFEKWYKKEKHYEKYTIISMESNDYIYSKFYLIISFIVAAIIMSIIAALSSIFLSSRLISNTLQSFLHSINQYNENATKEKHYIHKDDTEEIISIKKEFNRLISNLLETQIVKDNIKGIINSLSEYLLAVDINGKTQFTNTAFEKVSEDFSLKECSDFTCIIPECYREKSLNTECIVNDFEHTYPKKTSNKKENNHVMIRWSRSLYYSINGELQGVIFIGTDITESRKVEQELHIKNRAIDEAGSGIVITNALDSRMPLVYANKHFLSMTGYIYSEVINKDFCFLQGKNTDNNTIKDIILATKNKKRITRTILNYRKNQSEFYNQITLSPIHDQDGKITHYLGIQFDVTDQVKADQELLEAKKKAEESAQLKSEFLASMSHEIRTPMNGVIGMLGLLQRTSLSQKQHHYTELAESSAQSLLSLINDILDFSKVEAGKMELEMINFNLSKMMGEFVETMSQRTQEKGITLILDIVDIPYISIKSDPTRLRQILTNLVGNAIKFTEEGEIIIKAHLEKVAGTSSILHCTVSDTGIGIPASKIDNLFDSFSQVDASTTRKYGGTGLGLAIAKKLCLLMKGSISASSIPGKGSEFYFTIAIETDGPINNTQTAIDIKDIDILIVDKNVTERHVLKKQLLHWGASVTEASTAEEALISLENQHPTLTMIDQKLPGMGSLMLAKMIRSIPKYNDIHLAIMAPLSERIDEISIEEHGFNITLPKPIIATNLLSSIKLLEKNKQYLANNPSSHFMDNTPTLTSDTESLPKNLIKNILLVEDSSINQEVALGILNALGFDADISNNGKEALEQLNKYPKDNYALILMDCQMPEMDGYETTENIRSGKTPNKDIPIIAMTANAIKGDKEKCLAAGMDDYISKPVDPERLQSCLSQWMPHTESTPTKEEASPIQYDHEETIHHEEIWDEDGFMKRVMNNEKIAEKLIHLFSEDTPKTIEELERAIKEKEIEKIGRTAHKLKGSAGNLGGVQLASIFQKIEAASNENKIEDSEELWQYVTPAYNTLLNAIKNNRPHDNEKNDDGEHSHHV